MIPTKNSPKSIDDLENLLAGDNKVKVAGKSTRSKGKFKLPDARDRHRWLICSVIW
jgi:hypothetical protein